LASRSATAWAAGKPTILRRSLPRAQTASRSMTAGGGFKPYVPEKLPAGPTGISVGDGMGGWKAYNPPPKPPAGPNGISVDDGRGRVQAVRSREASRRPDRHLHRRWHGRLESIQSSAEASRRPH